MVTWKGGLIMENISKSRIDKVGKILTKSEYYSNEEINLAEQKLNQYKKNSKDNREIKAFKSHEIKSTSRYRWLQNNR